MTLNTGTLTFNILKRIEVKEATLQCGAIHAPSAFQYPQTDRSQGSYDRARYERDGQRRFQYPQTDRSQGSRGWRLVERSPADSFSILKRIEAKEAWMT
ncbi:MAG TPA: hypothetical protein VKQ36_04910 [Ktedonobacterales bacterium]|nr:hypothetical protein [Ktedonobacterales bacterium]